MHLRSSWALPATLLLILLSWKAEPQNPAPAEVFPSGVAKAAQASGSAGEDARRSTGQDSKNEQASPSTSPTDSKQANPSQTNSNQANPNQANPNQTNPNQKTDKSATPDQEEGSFVFIIGGRECDILARKGMGMHIDNGIDIVPARHLD